MPLRKHNKNQRPSASRATRTGGRSRRAQGQTQPSLSAEEMRERAEAYARMHRGGEEHHAHVNDTSQLPAEQPMRHERLTPVQKQPAQKQSVKKRSVKKKSTQKQPTQKQSVQKQSDAQTLAGLESSTEASISTDAQSSADVHSSTEAQVSTKDTSSTAQQSSSQTKARSSKSKVRTTQKKRKDSSKQRRFKPLFIVLAVLAAILLVATSVLAWNQWLRFDDKADIQGTWYVDGTDSSITITDTQIVLTDSVSYDYTIDTFNKTITFRFSHLQGTGTYAFSPERDALIITEQDASSVGGSVPTKLVRTAASGQAAPPSESAEAANTGTEQ